MTAIIQDSQDSTTQLTQYQDINNLRLATNEDVIDQRVKIPNVILNQVAEKGPQGNFLLSEGKDEAGKTLWKDLGPTYQAVILKVRRCLRGFDGQKAYYTWEVDGWQEITPLFENGTQIDESNMTMLQTKYSAVLRVNYVLYLYDQGEPRKMYVKGKSLVSLFQYLNSFPKSQDSVINYVTQMSSHAEKKGMVNYFVTDFKRGETSPQNKVFPVLLEINQLLERIKQSAKSTLNLKEPF